MWSGAISLSDKRYSNAPIERWFGIIKNQILNGQANQKCSRVLRKIREHVTFISKEVRLGLNKDRCTRPGKSNTENSINNDFDLNLLSQETWAKKQKKLVSNSFKGENLKIYIRKEIKQEVKHLEIENIFCGFCRCNNDSENQGPINWLCCDICNNWIHRICAKKHGLETSADLFACSKCLDKSSSQDHHMSDSKKNYRCQIFDVYHYYDYIKRTFQENVETLRQIEYDTRVQRNNQLWINERKRRVTCSILGQICKSRDEKRLLFILSNILQSQIIS